MKKQRSKFLLLSMLMAGAVSFTACQDDDTDVTILSAVAGDYLGHEACPPSGTPAAHEYAVTVYNQSDASNGKVYIENIYEIGGKYEGTVNGNTITVAPTAYTYTSGGKTYKGNLSATGTVSGSVLTLNFTLTGDDTSTCQFVGDRDARH